MHYVILRDDDTCALTPVECLEQLYRPFLDRGLPVHLGVIPDVCTDARRADGQREEFLQFNHGTTTPLVPVGQNRALVQYLSREPHLHLLHHGYDHSFHEFDCDFVEADRRLQAGAQRFAVAGLPRPAAFVAPYDRMSADALRAAAQHYPVVSSGWYELRRMPTTWWPTFLHQRWQHREHLRCGGAMLLTHPGCLLSRFRRIEGMFEAVQRTIRARPLTVLVTHWWEYFRQQQPDRQFIGVLHQVADFLAHSPDVRVITIADLASGRVTVPGLLPVARSARPAPRRGTGPIPLGRPAYW